MYARQPPEGRPPRNLRIPRNYSGNAFVREDTVPAAAGTATDEEMPPVTPAEPSLATASEAEAVSAEAHTADTESAPPSDTDPAPADKAAAKLFPSPGFRLDFGRLFRKDRGFGLGTEELLLLGLILLVSQSDTKDDLIFLLLLLLFVQ